MGGGDYEWQITFTKEGFMPLTLSESHKDFKEIQKTPGIEMLSASLINLRKFSLFDDKLDAIVHHIQLPGAKLKRLFRRTERGLFGGMQRVIPAIEYESEGKTMYAFAFPDRVFLTTNRKFYRKDWSNATT